MNNKSVIKEKKVKIKLKKNKSKSVKKIKIKKNTIGYELKKYDYESDFIYQIRKRFIDFYKPKNEKDFKLYEMYSNILINMVFLKCKYSSKTENKIKNYVNKEKNNIIKNLKNLNNLK